MGTIFGVVNIQEVVDMCEKDSSFCQSDTLLWLKQNLHNNT